MEPETESKSKTQSKSTTEFKETDIKTAFGWLKSDKNGLSKKEAAARAEEYGFNEVTEKKTNALNELLMHFWGPIPWLLEFATILCFLVGNRFDGFVFAFIVVVNGFIEYKNEHDSRQALELLKKKLTIKTRVLRDGIWETRDARELVPGDVIVVSLGDVVPADIKIFEGQVSADQSALTGESLPVELHESDILFTSSTIKRGEARAVVVNTAMRTYFGKTVELVNIAKPKSKTEEIMFSISKNVTYMGAFMFFLVLLVAYSRETSLPVILTFAVLFIGGGIPATLPMMFTLAQAKGATDLSKKEILVTKLDSVENAASVEVLCLDKTGTITMNEMEVYAAIPFSDASEKELLALSALASSDASKDAIDSLIMKYAAEKEAKLPGYTQMSYTPFTPATKRAEAKVKGPGGKTILAMKGAPQVVLSLCKGADKEVKDGVAAKMDELSKKGCRILAVAKSGFDKFDDLEFVGLLALADPLRKDSAATIAKLREAGIKPIMLTGDNIAVAREIAKQAGIGTRVMRIADIKALPGEKEQAAAMLEVDGVAEIYPEDKYWVVKLLQSQGKTVGMTGDGVNDAPALKQAELGIAVSNATDVAKAAASMVLTKPGTGDILDAVKTSRETYQRMLTWTLKKISRAIQFMLILTVGFVIFQDVIVSITGLVLLMVVNDFLTMSLAVDNTRASKSPNAWKLWNITAASTAVGILMFLAVLIILWLGIKQFGLNLAGVQTLMLLGLIYTGQLGIYIIRERGHFWQSWPNRTVGIILWAAIIFFSALAVYGLVLTPLPTNEILITFVICAGAMMLIDLPKHFIYQKLNIT